MRGVRLLAAAAAIGAAAVTAACGQPTAASPGGPGGPGGPASGGSPGGPASAASPGCRGAAQAPAHGPLVLGTGDNGRSFCLAQGTSVLVILRGSPGHIWAPVRATPAVLAPRANGHLALARWATGAAFAAIRPGTAVLSSMRPACVHSVPAGARSSSPPTMTTCLAELAFRATVVVTGR